MATVAMRPSCANGSRGAASPPDSGPGTRATAPPRPPPVTSLRAGRDPARRGLAAELVTVNASDDLPASLDCYVIGGGEDLAERAAAPLLHAAPLLRAWEGGASIVAVCAGFQLLGTDVELSPRERVTG